MRVRTRRVHLIDTSAGGVPCGHLVEEPCRGRGRRGTATRPAGTRRPAPRACCAPRSAPATTWPGAAGTRSRCRARRPPRTRPGTWPPASPRRWARPTAAGTRSSANGAGRRGSGSRVPGRRQAWGGGSERVEGRRHLSVGVEAVQPVDLLEPAGLAEPAHARGASPARREPSPRNASVCGWPSSTVTIGAARSAGNACSSTHPERLRPAGARLERPEQQVRAGDDDDVGRDTVLGQTVGGCERLRHASRPSPRASRPGQRAPDVPCAAGSPGHDVPSAPLAGSRVGRDLAPGPGRPAGSRAAGTLEPPVRPPESGQASRAGVHSASRAKAGS